ncbi:MAG: lipopolysaccharide assembly protein LapA domain-containing protein [Gaiellaceae bacterium]
MSSPQPPGIPDAPSPRPPPAETTRAGTPPAAEPPPAAEDVGEDRPSTWQPWLYVKIGLLLFAIAWAIAFVVENTKQINVHFVFATANVHVVWMILLLLAVGLVGGVLLSQLYRHRRRAQLAEKRRKTRDASGDVGGRDKTEGKAR